MVKKNKVSKKQIVLDFDVAIMIKKGELNTVVICAPPQPFKKGSEKQVRKILDLASLNIKKNIYVEIDKATKKLNELL